MAMHVAAEKGHDQVIKLLAKRGANLESKSNTGRTPLMLAAKEGKSSAVKLLLELGANIDARGSFGKTAMSEAKENYEEEVVQVLKEWKKEKKRQRQEEWRELFGKVKQKLSKQK